MPKLSSDDWEEIKKLRNNGMTFTEIGKKYNVSKQSIQQKLTYNSKIPKKQEIEVDEEILNNKFEKVNKQIVVNMVNWGYVRNLKVCASLQKPYDSYSYLISTDTFRNVASFLRWHSKIKKTLCNEVNGKSLTYYIIKEE